MSIVEHENCNFCNKVAKCAECDTDVSLRICEPCVDKLKNQFDSNIPPPGLTVKLASKELTVKYPFSDRTVKTKPYESPAKRKARAMYREQGEEIPGDSKHLEDETWTFKDGYLNQDNN